MSETPHRPKPPDLAATEAYDELPPRLLRKLKVSVPGYKLQKVIARGGQAIVLKAIQQATGKAVAIKLLREGPLADSAARGRLQREVAVMATLDHPNIVTVIDSGVTPEGLDYLAMNFVSGQPLHEFMEESRIARQHPNDAAWLLKVVHQDLPGDQCGTFAELYIAISVPRTSWSMMMANLIFSISALPAPPSTVSSRGAIEPSASPASLSAS